MAFSIIVENAILQMSDNRRSPELLWHQPRAADLMLAITLPKVPKRVERQNLLIRI